MIENMAAVLGVVSVWFVVRRNIWAFPIGTVMVLLYAWVFFQAKLYSDMLLQFFFAAMQTHGWLEWRRGDKAADEKVAVRKLSQSQWLWTLAILFPGFFALGWLMDSFTDAAAPFADAFVAVLSVLAQWWMNKRFLENWLLWMVVNVVAVVLYFSRGLFPTSVLYFIFLIMAVVGYFEWKKKVISKSF